MEEQKKEVKLKPIKTDANSKSEKNQKLTYEQLNQACIELSQQNQQMQTYIKKLQHQMIQMEGMLQAKRMDYLFKVIELYMKSEKFFDTDYVLKCAEEIQESLTIPEEEQQEETKKN